MNDNLKRKKDPLVLVIDDDPVFNKIIERTLQKLGVRSQIATDPHRFLQELKDLKPDLCLVDLNIGDKLGLGFTILKAIRNVLGPDLPIFIITGTSNHDTIQHAMSIGATDYIVKPIDRSILASKLSRYLSTDELLSINPSLIPVPEGGVSANVEIEMKIHEVEESGLRLTGNHLIAKDMAIYLDGSMIHELTGSTQPLLVTITSSWAEAQDGVYGAFAEFDTTNRDLRTAIRRWLIKKQKDRIKADAQA